MAYYKFSPADVRDALGVILAPGQVIELRALNAWVAGERGPGTFSGYFDAEHIDCLITQLRRIRAASACYFTPNPVNPALLGRAYNRARIVRDREPTTGDKDIAYRRWLLIDIDAVRPSGLSATAAEQEAAMELAVDIDCYLFERGYPPGIIADSGNGAHVMIPVSLPANDRGAIERTLKSLAKEFDTAAAKVDTSVHNPARIWKLPGTLVCKGDHCPAIGREWRMARITQVCTEVPDDA